MGATTWPPQDVTDTVFYRQFGVLMMRQPLVSHLLLQRRRHVTES